MKDFDIERFAFTFARIVGTIALIGFVGVFVYVTARLIVPEDPPDPQLAFLYQVRLFDQRLDAYTDSELLNGAIAVCVTQKQTNDLYLTQRTADNMFGEEYGESVLIAAFMTMCPDFKDQISNVK